VQAVTLAEVADELYALPPAEFTAARDERARVAKAAGRREDAAAIKKLTRPTTSAWLVNQLSREAPDGLGRLVEVADALQEAQRTLAGDRLRELSAQRRQAVTELLPVAAAVADRAGQPASPGVLEEVRATLEAAVADNDAREAVRSGRLTRALAYAGLGEVDLTAAIALAPANAPERPGRVPPAGHGAARPGQAKPRRRALGPGRANESLAAGSAEPDPAAAVAAAQSAAGDAASAVSAAEHELMAISEQRQFLRRRISHLEGELAQTREEDARLAADAQRAEKSRDAAARDLRAAERQLTRSRRDQARYGKPSEN
jgi:hypothetical protein